MIIDDFTGTPETEWEYHSFVHTEFEPKKNWASLSFDDHYLYPLVLKDLWQDFEPQIRAEVHRWQEIGWDPVEPVAPTALKLQSREFIDRGISASDIVLWVATFGLALMVTLLLGGFSRRYVIFEPVEFRILMRRPLTRPEIEPTLFSNRSRADLLPQGQ